MGNREATRFANLYQQYLATCYTDEDRRAVLIEREDAVPRVVGTNVTMDARRAHYNDHDLAARLEGSESDSDEDVEDDEPDISTGPTRKGKRKPRAPRVKTSAKTAEHVDVDSLAPPMVDGDPQANAGVDVDQLPPPAAPVEGVDRQSRTAPAKRGGKRKRVRSARDEESEEDLEGMDVDDEEDGPSAVREPRPKRQRVSSRPTIESDNELSPDDEDYLPQDPRDARRPQPPRASITPSPTSPTPPRVPTTPRRSSPSLPARSVSITKTVQPVIQPHVLRPTPEEPTVQSPGPSNSATPQPPTTATSITDGSGSEGRKLPARTYGKAAQSTTPQRLQRPRPHPTWNTSSSKTGPAAAGEHSTVTNPTEPVQVPDAHVDAASKLDEMMAGYNIGHLQYAWSEFAAAPRGGELIEAMCSVWNIERKWKEEKTCEHALPVSHRPAIVGRWMKRGRAFKAGRTQKKMPRICLDRNTEKGAEEVDDFLKNMHVWYASIQPAWRVFSGQTWGREAEEADWGVWQSPGANGLVLLIAALSWWGEFTLENPESHAEWTEMVLDATWMLSRLEKEVVGSK